MPASVGDILTIHFVKHGYKIFYKNFNCNSLELIVNAAVIASWYALYVPHKEELLAFIHFCHNYVQTQYALNVGNITC